MDPLGLDFGEGFPDDLGYERRQLADALRRLGYREAALELREQHCASRERYVFWLGAAFAVVVLVFAMSWGGCGWWPFPAPEPRPAVLGKAERIGLGRTDWGSGRARCAAGLPVGLANGAARMRGRG